MSSKDLVLHVIFGRYSKGTRNCFSSTTITKVMSQLSKTECQPNKLSSLLDSANTGAAYFRLLHNRDGLTPSQPTFVNLLVACANTEALQYGYILNGCVEEGLKLVRNIVRVGVKVSQFGFSGVLSVCVGSEFGEQGSKDLGKGQQVFLDSTDLSLVQIIENHRMCENSISSCGVVGDTLKVRHISLCLDL
ncbi:hypothetical protein SUGI_1107350 [Cryptomeria japonica]|nr:hypothetical protein SUGI_1107350 [Cryptomeria japonica]